MNDRGKVQRFLAKLLALRTQRILLVALLAGLLVAGLHPFNFYPHNQVAWLTGTKGVRWQGYGEVVGGAPLGSVGHSDLKSPAPEMTVELWATSRDTSLYVKDIVSIYVSRDLEPFAIEQWGTRLLIAGWFRDKRGNRKFQRIGINSIFANGVRRFLTVTSGPDGTKIFLEGVLQDSSPGLMLEPENLDGSLLLGQTAMARQEWHGDILGLAFYGQALTPDEVAENFAAWQRGDLQALQTRVPGSAIYPFDEGHGATVRDLGNAGGALSIPDRLRAVHPLILASPSYQDLSNVSDVTLNVLGFIPFGVLLAIYASSVGASNRRAVIVAVLLGFLVSLTIELLQVLLPSRDSSLLDLIDNVLGTGIGAGIAGVLWPRVRRLRESFH
jgi:VanZ family protein